MQDAVRKLAAAVGSDIDVIVGWFVQLVRAVLFVISVLALVVTVYRISSLLRILCRPLVGQYLRYSRQGVLLLLLCQPALCQPCVVC